jgi:hypothetical protein
MNNNNNSGSLWPVFIIVLLVGSALATMLSSSVSNQTATFSPDTTSREYRYVKERVKLEGYSDREAAQAADAIMKFHNAQKARGQ